MHYLNLVVFLDSLFSLFCRLQQKIGQAGETISFELKKVVEHNTTHIKIAHRFLITAITWMNFWTEGVLCFISDCKNLFISELIKKNLWLSKYTTFTLRAPTGKIIKTSFFYLSVYHFHWIQSANTEFMLKTTDRLLANETNMHHCKNPSVLQPIIHNKNKTKKTAVS